MESWGSADSSFKGRCFYLLPEEGFCCTGAVLYFGLTLLCFSFLRQGLIVQAGLKFTIFLFHLPRAGMTPKYSESGVLVFPIRLLFYFISKVNSWITHRSPFKVYHFQPNPLFCFLVSWTSLYMLCLQARSQAVWLSEIPFPLGLLGFSRAWVSIHKTRSFTL